MARTERQIREKTTAHRVILVENATVSRYSHGVLYYRNDFIMIANIVVARYWKGDCDKVRMKQLLSDRMKQQRETYSHVTHSCLFHSTCIIGLSLQARIDLLPSRKGRRERSRLQRPSQFEYVIFMYCDMLPTSDSLAHIYLTHSYFIQKRTFVSRKSMKSIPRLKQRIVTTVLTRQKIKERTIAPPVTRAENATVRVKRMDTFIMHRNMNTLIKLFSWWLYVGDCDKVSASWRWLFRGELESVWLTKLGC
jgi:hypothetical protein